MQLKTLEFDGDFIKKYLDYEKYAALYPRNIAILGNWDSTNPDYEVLLKISTIDGKSIYRKGVANATLALDSNSVMLGVRSRRELQLQNDTQVGIKKTNWFMYLWFNIDSTIKWPFRVAVLFGLTSVILSVLSIIICAPTY